MRYFLKVDGRIFGSPYGTLAGARRARDEAQSDAPWSSVQICGLRR
jgi:hypothetical protein